MNKQVLVSFIGIAVAGITFGLVGPVTVILLETHGAPALVTGAVTTMLYLSIVLFSSYTGRLADKYTTKKILGAGFALVFTGSIASVFWDNYYILFPARFISGLGSTFLFVTTEIIINANSSDSDRGRNISNYVVLLSAGIAAGTFLIWTVKIAEWLPFVIGASMMLIAYVFEARYLDEISAGRKTEETVKFPFSKMPPAALLSSAIYGVYEAAFTVAIPVYGLRCGYTQSEVSYFLSSYVVGGIVLLYMVGRLSDRISKYHMLLLVSALLTVLLAFIMAFSSPVYYIVLFFVLGGLVPAFYSVGLAYTIEKVDREYMAQANGHYSMAYGLGTLIGPLSGSFLLEFNLRYSFWSAASLLSLFFFLYFAFIYKEKKAFERTD